MAFSIDELTKKAKSVANMAADKTKDAAELVKINVAIAGEQKEIEKNYRAVGEWFVNEYEGEIPEAVQAIVEAINASKAWKPVSPSGRSPPGRTRPPLVKSAPSAARSPTANSVPTAARLWVTEHQAFIPGPLFFGRFRFF